MELNGKKVTRVYSGKPGCACGCRGTYWDADNPKHARQITRIANIISRSTGPDIKTTTDDDFIAVEDGSRVYVAYF